MKKGTILLLLSLSLFLPVPAAAQQLLTLEDCRAMAVEANRELGIEPVAVPARGGTDGAQLTFRGLPCPNIATGGYSAHSVREFIPVPSLEITVDLLERLVAKFAAVRA